MLVLNCTLKQSQPVTDKQSKHAEARFGKRKLRYHSLKSDILTRCSNSQNTGHIPQPTPVSRRPVQSVAILAVTDGLPPWFDIDRFHMSHNSIFLSHFNGSRGGIKTVLHYPKTPYVSNVRQLYLNYSFIQIYSSMSSQRRFGASQPP